MTNSLGGRGNSHSFFFLLKSSCRVVGHWVFVGGVLGRAGVEFAIGGVLLPQVWVWGAGPWWIRREGGGKGSFLWKGTSNSYGLPRSGRWTLKASKCLIVTLHGSRGSG